MTVSAVNPWRTAFWKARCLPLSVLGTGAFLRIAAVGLDLAKRGHVGKPGETADGTCIRDYIHVADIADAHIRALEYLLSGGPSCALNLANAQGYSVMEVIQVALRVSGRKVRAEMAPRRPGDPPVLIGLAHRAKTLLKWTLKRSALELQIADAWKWMGTQQGFWKTLTTTGRSNWP